MSIKKTESQIQTEVLNYLLRKGIFCWRQNNQAVYDKKLNNYRAHVGLKGVPDIIAITPATSKQCGGIFVGIEIKTSKGKLSVDQILFRDRCYRHNAEYHVVTSLEDIKKLDYLWK
jgi:hypothetical protein